MKAQGFEIQPEDSMSTTNMANQQLYSDQMLNNVPTNDNSLISYVDKSQT